MKILLIGHYREKSGWGEITRCYIKALSKYVDLVIRPVIFQNDAVLDEDILSLEEKSQIGCTHCIQFTLPPYMSFDYRLKNIGIFMWETYNVPNIWRDYLFLPDKILTTNEEMCRSIYSELHLNSSPISIPMVDFHEEKINKELDDSFNFYFIGEVNPRKNLEVLIKCFHSTFSKHENVNLVLKVNKPGQTPQQVQQLAVQDIVSIKNGLRKHKNSSDYIDEIIITDYLPRQKIVALHNSCDCFVSCSHGEGISLSMIDAMMCNNPVLVPKNTGESSILFEITKNNKVYGGQNVNSTVGPCYKWDTLQGYANCEDKWVNIDENELCQYMRMMYNRGKKKLPNNLHEVYTLEKVGEELFNLCNI